MNQERKYRSEIFKIAGFSVMAPFGRIFLQPLEMFKEYGPLSLFLYVIIAFGLFIFGLLLIIKGLEQVDMTWRD